MALVHIGTVHERKNPVGKINNDFSSLNKHIKCDCVSFDVAQCAQMLPMFFFL